MGARSPPHGSARGAPHQAALLLLAALLSGCGAPALAAGGPFYSNASVVLRIAPLHPVQVPGVSPDRYLAFGLSQDAVVIDVLPERDGAAPDIV
ncbi:hypothetical protein Rsub_13388 [Raphidocelis subcapitata]|uniref:Uncharacterized protein n=1 Tax=Raphidocelis subcapitata TaxID=307507 RepID=A0A2V0PLJ5_9CHLO|nr:hypothetical protein Rsub_13388 [Raphidocelis subcapitata]|eukprot:GBG00652.1 hypothetical protein Rsub_13388 [Raphidocelis subcapitata]